MGGGIATCSLDLSNNTSSINRRDSFFHDLWSRDRHPSGNWIPNVKDQYIFLNSNDGMLEKSLDLIEERRENAMVQLAYYQHKLKQGYDVM